jgi:predicted ATPase
MKLEVSVKNLGQIKEANFHIRPITVITGPNGTGKSFFTKFLYSILNVVYRNAYRELITQSLRQISLQLERIINAVTDGDAEPANRINSEILQLKAEFEQVSDSGKMNDYLIFAKSKVKTVSDIEKQYGIYFNALKESIEQFEPIQSIAVSLHQTIIALQNVLSDYESACVGFLEKNISNELLENFQITDLKDLIAFEEKQLEINIETLLAVKLNAGRLSIDIGTDFIDEVSDLSNVVFFESPAYWKVRDALKSAKNNPNRPQLMGRKNDDILTGVPKYFYDLDIALNTRTKTEGAFKSATDLLTHALGGEFVFKGDELSFKDKSGREISKNLMSFGMTNLGMIQALLKYNIITAGSFIFIDEPETNLHPDWQVKLVEVLLLLAQGGVNIVITTHSSDLVKALEVKIKKLPIEVMEDFLSVHFVDTDGKLLEFESKDPLQQIIEARELLSLAYQQLYFSDL